MAQNRNDGLTGQIYIPGALHSTADENIVAYSGDIFDDQLQKNQRTINKNLTDNVDNLRDIVNLYKNSALGAFTYKGNVEYSEDKRTLPNTGSIGDVYFMNAGPEEEVGNIYICKTASKESYTWKCDSFGTLPPEPDIKGKTTTIINGTTYKVIQEEDYYIWAKVASSGREDPDNRLYWDGDSIYEGNVDEEEEGDCIKGTLDFTPATYVLIGPFTNIDAFYNLVETLLNKVTTLRNDCDSWQEKIKDAFLATINIINESNQAWKEQAISELAVWQTQVESTWNNFSSTITSDIEQITDKVNQYAFDVYAQANLNVYNANSNSRLIENKVNAIIDCLAEILPLLAYNTSNGYELSEQLVNKLKLIDLLTIEDTKFPVRPVYSENTSVVDVAICDVAVCDII